MIPDVTCPSKLGARCRCGKLIIESSPGCTWHKSRAEHSPIIEDLRAARLRQRLTQLAVADALGVSQVALSHWENGQRDPNLSVIVQWARVVHCTIQVEALR